MKTRIPATLLKLALCTAACFPPPAHTSTLNPGFENYRVATDDELDEMRGGFDLNAGPLHISFSIDHVTFINGTLVATTTLNLQSLNDFLNILSLNSLGNPQAFIASLQNAVGSSTTPATTLQNGQQNTARPYAVPNLPTTAPTTVTQNTVGGNNNPGTTPQNGTQNTPPLPATSNLPTTVSTSVMPNTTGGSSTPGVTAQNGSQNTSTLPATPLPTTVSSSVTQNTAGSSNHPGLTAQTGLQNTSPLPATTTSTTTVTQNAAGSSYNVGTTVQNGTKNIMPDGFYQSMASLNSVIQNTVDNQVIRNFTVVNTTLNSQALIRAMAISNSLSQMLNNSIR